MRVKVVLILLGAFFLVIQLVFIILNYKSSKYTQLFSGHEPVDSSHQNLDIPKEKEFWKTRIIDIGSKRSYEEFKVKYLKSTSHPHLFSHLFGEALYEVEGVSGASS